MLRDCRQQGQGVVRRKKLRALVIYLLEIYHAGAHIASMTLYSTTKTLKHIRMFESANHTSRTPRALNLRSKKTAPQTPSFL